MDKATTINLRTLIAERQSNIICELKDKSPYYREIHNKHYELYDNLNETLTGEANNLFNEFCNSALDVRALEEEAIYMQGLVDSFKLVLTLCGLGGTGII